MYCVRLSSYVGLHEYDAWILRILDLMSLSMISGRHGMRARPERRKGRGNVDFRSPSEVQRNCVDASNAKKTAYVRR